MKNKIIRKSCQPSNLTFQSANQRIRQKFLTGLNKDYQTYQKQQSNPNSYTNHLYNPQAYSQQPQCSQSHSYPHPYPSDSIISSPDNYTREELISTFNLLSNNKPHLRPEDLTQILQDQNQEQFKKYQMVRILDREGKGYVTLEEFVDFYEMNVVEGGGAGGVPEGYSCRRAWREIIDGQTEGGYSRKKENQRDLEFVGLLAEEDFCHYVVGELKRIKDINGTNSFGIGYGSGFGGKK